MRVCVWDDLLADVSQTGMETYEQDWLCTEFDGMNATKQNATLGRDWLIQMGERTHTARGGGGGGAGGGGGGGGAGGGGGGWGGGGGGGGGAPPPP